MIKKGLLIIISGFSGTGKGTVIKRLLELYPNDYCLSISATTRNPREGEVHGREYFFKTKEDFEEMLIKQELIEYTQYVDNYYGTPKEYVEDQMEAGHNIILEIEIDGALNVKKLYPDALLIFLLPPSIRELEKRLKERGTEKEDVIADRINRAREEAKVIREYDYVVVNDTIDDCVSTIHNIVETEGLKAYRQEEVIHNIEKELGNVCSE
ncbi:MAG: guanylate kinase [Lachnospiraceae bacterium]|nr:guanylate kinase [Lachnospiraceae bacterium]